METPLAVISDCDIKYSGYDGTVGQSYTYMDWVGDGNAALIIQALTEAGYSIVKMEK
jgi:hypothetical protein